MASGPGTVAAMTAAMASTIGAHETNGNNTNYITQWYGMNDEWCNMTVTYAAYHSGNEQSVCFGGKYAYTVYHAQAFADHGAWHAMTNGVVNSGIREGDIIFFDWSGGTSISGIDHVGYVTGVSGNVVHTIEGNIGNVCARFDRTVESIAGFGRPVYNPAAVPAPPVVSNAPWISGRQVIWASMATVANQKRVAAGPDNPRDDVANVQAGLVSTVKLSGHEVGIWDSKTQAAMNLYRTSKMGLSGSDATGSAGEQSLTHLAATSKKFQARDFTGGYTPKFVAAPTPPPASDRIASPWPSGISNSAVDFSFVPDTSVNATVKKLCARLGVPSADWEAGFDVLTQRESNYNPNAVNKWDSNAAGSRQADGAPWGSSRGVAQVTPDTFVWCHMRGTSNKIYDVEANIGAAMNWVIFKYGVAKDGHNFQALVHQANPNHVPEGY